MEPSLRNLVESETLEWVFVGGKGGVGKTTTSCSLAVSYAKAGRSTLLISTDPAHNLSDAFGQKFGAKPTAIKHNLEGNVAPLAAMEIEPPKDLGSLPPEIIGSLGEDAADQLGQMGSLLQMLPGIDEAVSFGYLMQAVQKMDYSVIVFDTAPTGHTMRLLSFPSLLSSALGKMRELHNRFGGMLGTVAAGMGGGPGAPALPSPEELSSRLTELESLVRRVIDQFEDTSRTTFVCVCIPEFLSVYETERLMQELNKFNIDSRALVVNQVIELEEARGKEDELYNARLAIQQKYLDQVQELYSEDFHIVRVPILDSEVRGMGMLRQYSGRLLDPAAVEKEWSLPGKPEDDSEPYYEPSLQNIVVHDSLKWVFVGGKGGVGKTTTSCSLALACAQTRIDRDQKVLVVSLDPAHNLSDAFGHKVSPGGKPTVVEGQENLFALEIDPKSGTESLFEGLIPENLLPPEMVESLSSSIPGIDEAIAVSQIMKLVRELDFDFVVFDTAPTGHTLRLLKFPELLNQALAKLTELRDRFGPMLGALTGPDDPTAEVTLASAAAKLDDLRSNLEQVTGQLRDPARSTFVCVAIAEYLSVYETERLVQELAEMEIDVGNVVVNQLMRPTECDKAELLRTRAAMQKKYLDQVAELYPSEEFHVVKMPLLPREVRGVEQLVLFAERAVWNKK